MDGWAKYVWQSGVGIEGYYIACFECNAPFKVLYRWTLFKRMEPTCGYIDP